jgi:sugar transferase (PEP-CTERM/EpsH1 system associated)
LSFVASQEEKDNIAPLRELVSSVEVVHQSPAKSAASVLLNAYRPDPLQVLYYRSREMARIVRRKLAEHHYDAAYIHLFRMAPYLARATGLYRIVDLTDAISMEIGRSMAYRRPLSRFVYAVERPRIERYERWVCQTFEETWLISEMDRAVLARACPDDRIQVIPNGVDLDRFSPLERRADPNLILFVGHMGVLHNIDAVSFLARDILPRIRRAVPNCRLEIVGAEPASEVMRLGSEPGVHVAGFVPDLNAALNRAAVFVAPLRFAAGVQNKVLEAMAAGRPVVTTSLVNQGLRAQPGHEILIGDSASEITERVLTVLGDPPRAQEIGGAAREFVRRNMSWRGAVRRMATIERDILGAGG